MLFGYFVAKLWLGLKKIDTKYTLGISLSLQLYS